MEKRWELKNVIPQDFINTFPEIDPIILQLLYNRDLTSQEQMDSFLSPDFMKDLHDPFIFKDMEKAVARIIKALDNNESILVYGDYDADGVSSSVLVVSTLKALGGNVNIYIPHREIEGYGLTPVSVKEILKHNYDLLITVDCGISNKDEVEELQKHGVDIIVTDHHAEPLRIPEAYALINPQLSRENYPYKKLAGVGVAYKTMQALLKTLEQQDKYYDKDELDKYSGYKGLEKWLLDLVAIGTVTDCMPLVDENRVLVKYGLLVMQKTKRVGLKSLIAHANSSLDSVNTYTIGFQIGPRINAAGRVDHANIAYNLLITDDFDEAETLSNTLNETNIARQKLTEEMVRDIEVEMEEQKDNSILFAYREDWMMGVVGLVAGRVSEKYNKPVFLMTTTHGTIGGSGRSIREFNMIDALQEVDDLFDKYGGHKQACGFTLKNAGLIDEFKTRVGQLANKALEGKDTRPVLSIDTELSIEDTIWKLVESVESFMPFGSGNPKPLFLIKNVEIAKMQLVGSTKNHIRLLVKGENSHTMRKAIAFGIGNTWGSQLAVGDKVDIVTQIGFNEWNGNREIQLTIQDLRFSESEI